MSELKITKDNFKKEVLDSNQPVLLDFWAPWCGPCQMMGTAVAQIAEQYAGKAKVGKVNVDEEMELAEQFMVSSIPAFFFLKNGKVEKALIGARPKQELEQSLEKLL